jgi:hypothetical protein
LIHILKPALNLQHKNISINHMVCHISLEARQELECLPEATAQIANRIILEEDQDRQFRAQVNEAAHWYRSSSEAPFSAYGHSDDVDPYESDSELLPYDENCNEEDSPYLKAGVVVGTEFEFAQFQRTIGFLTASNSSTEVIQEVDSAPHNAVCSTASVLPTTQVVPKTNLLDAFSLENLKQDLLRCPCYLAPDPQYTEDYLHYLAGEYARTIRLLRLQRRWSTTNTPDWNAEIDLLLSAINDSSNNFIL